MKNINRQLSVHISIYELISNNNFVIDGITSGIHSLFSKYQTNYIGCVLVDLNKTLEENHNQEFPGKSLK